MNDTHRFSYSVIEFRPDPARRSPDDLLLGLALEFATPKYWVVAVGMLPDVPNDKIELLDPLSQELLKDPSHLLDSEIKEARHGAEKPGDVLARLANNNPWAIHVSSPKQVEIREENLQAGSSVERLVDDLLWQVMTKELSAPHPVVEASRFEAPPPIAADDFLKDAPPVWMRPRHWQSPIFEPSIYAAR